MAKGRTGAFLTLGAVDNLLNYFATDTDEVTFTQEDENQREESYNKGAGSINTPGEQPPGVLGALS